MIESALTQFYFLRPLNPRKPNTGYVNRVELCAQLQEGAAIGRFDQHGEFQKDDLMTERYQSVIPRIADALSCEPQDPRYREFKAANIRKGDLDINFEWLFEKHFMVRNMAFSEGSRFIKFFSHTPLLIDMHGPCYEVVFPNTLEKALALHSPLGEIRAKVTLH